MKKSALRKALTEMTAERDRIWQAHRGNFHREQDLRAEIRGLESALVLKASHMSVDRVDPFKLPDQDNLFVTLRPGQVIARPVIREQPQPGIEPVYDTKYFKLVETDVNEASTGVQPLGSDKIHFSYSYASS